jgi:prolyl-tRNA synthetase
MNAGEKGWSWVKKGIPVTVEVGPRDMEKNSVYVGRRDKERKERYGQDRDAFIQEITSLLDDIQQNLYNRAKDFRKQYLTEIDEWDAFQAYFTPQNKEKPEIHGGFAMAHWCDDEACESRVNQELAVSIRCVPFDREKSGPGSCVVCGKPSSGRVVFAKAY